MKVRIDFENDDESSFSAVEFVAHNNVGTIDGWSNAVADFVRASTWDNQLVVLGSLILISDDGVMPHQSGWFRDNKDKIEMVRDMLSNALRSLQEEVAR